MSDFITLDREHSHCRFCDATINDAQTLATVTGSVESTCSTETDGLTHTATVRRAYAVSQGQVIDAVQAIIVRHNVEAMRCDCPNRHESFAAHEIYKLLKTHAIFG